MWRYLCPSIKFRVDARETCCWWGCYTSAGGNTTRAGCFWSSWWRRSPSRPTWTGWGRRLWYGRWQCCWPLSSWRLASWRHWHEPTPPQSTCWQADRPELDRQSLGGRPALIVADLCQPTVLKHTIQCLQHCHSTARHSLYTQINNNS